MSKSLEIASDIVAGKKLIEVQKEKIKKLHQELVQAIHQEYPIISLVGSPMVYTRASWGRIEEAHETLTAEYAERYGAFEPKGIFDGETLNKEHDTETFFGNDLYVVYVVSDYMDTSDEFDKEVFELLAISIGDKSKI